MGDEVEKFENNRSHNQFIVELNTIEYTPELLQFSGKKRTINNESDYTPGLMLGVAREMRIGKGFSWTLKLGGFLNHKKDDEVEKGPVEVPELVSQYEQETKLYGGEASVNLNYQIETSWIMLQPFINFTLAKGKAESNVFYNYDLATVNEQYNVETTENFNMQKIGLGMNFISSSGIFSYLSANYNNMNIEDRARKGTYRADGGSTQAVDTKESVNSSNSFMSYHFGVGYRF